MADYANKNQSAASSFESGFRDATGMKKRKPDGTEEEAQPSAASEMLKSVGEGINSAAEMLGFAKKKK